MMNVLYEPFPESLNVDGTEYPIITDFREWFRFADMMEDNGLSDSEKLWLMHSWFSEPPKRMTSSHVHALIDFYSAKALENDPTDSDENEDDEPVCRPPVISWRIDSKFILGDFRRYYGINLIETEYMHWWEFRSLFAALPDDSQMMKRIGYRGADLSQIKNEAERKRIMKMKQLFALPFEMDDEDIGAVFGGAF